jgi:hypothetical protein
MNASKRFVIAASFLGFKSAKARFDLKEASAQEATYPT